MRTILAVLLLGAVTTAQISPAATTGTNAGTTLVPRFQVP